MRAGGGGLGAQTLWEGSVVGGLWQGGLARLLPSLAEEARLEGESQGVLEV